MSLPRKTHSFLFFIKLLICFLGFSHTLQAGSTDKSGLKPQVLNLPSGPGSIEGLGESFEAQLNSGTATYRVPLSVPPGRTGFAPSLALVYNGGNGNSPVGMGWRLSMPFVQRQTDKGLPIYDDVKDSFVTDKGEELVFIGDGKYRCENETSFDRFERSIAEAGKINTAWQAAHKNGATSYFGLVQTARVENNTHIFRWNLSKQVDTNGNEIVYHYNESSAFTNNTVPIDGQSYLTSIVYNQSTSGHAMQVNFHYETRLIHDQLFDYRPRFPLQTSQRITRIVMWEGEQRVRSYTLGYDPQSMLSRLNQVAMYGRDASIGPLESILHLAYTGFELNSTITAMETGFQPGVSLKLADVELADINADALPDILHTGDVHQVYLNHDGQQWEEPYDIPGGFSEFKLNSPNTMLMDMNGDGFVDLFTQDVSINGYRYFSGGTQYTLEDKNRFGWKSQPIEFSNSPNFTFDTVTKPLDLDNDGRIDVMRKLTFSDQVACVFNKKGTAYSSLFTIESPSTKAEFNFSASNSTLQLADMNGDGLQDFVVLNGAGQLWYYPGHGVTQDSSTPLAYQGWDRTARNWPASISGAEGYWMQQVPDEFDEADFAQAAKFRAMRLLDINGDGLTDLVYVANNQLKAWLNRGGYEFSASPYTISSATGQIPSLDAETSIRTADMNANGTIDVVWNRQTGFSDINHSNATWVYLDLTDGVRPNLLQRIDNGIGKITSISYKSAITDRVSDRNQGHEWAFKLPIALNVVDKI
ncbi:MAG: VCBS repeat-containing protein, partial [Methyloprofundus sp.]|nr:VCBS repeat-containing protein [Methyloprofundus sp.]